MANTNGTLFLRTLFSTTKGDSRPQVNLYRQKKGQESQFLAPSRRIPHQISYWLHPGLEPASEMTWV